jgi:DNA ligase-4
MQYKFPRLNQLQHYELRFPRITKYYLPSERKWQESSALEEVHKLALESVGRDRSDKDISDWANITWGKLASPRADCPLKRETKAELWEKRLAQLDGRTTILPDERRRTPSRRKRSENDSPEEIRQIIRRKTDSLPGPLSTRTNVHDAPNNVLTPPPSPSPAKPPWENISDEVLVWFPQPARKLNVPCASMSAWKRRVPREMRLHSLDSLLLGSDSSGRVGVIVVDECDEHAEKWTSLIREKVVSRPIVVYGCRTGVVSRRECISRC